MITVNYMAVLVAALAGFVFGFLWHGPIFGKLWIGLMGFTAKQMEEGAKKGMCMTMVYGFLAQVVTAFVLSQLLAALGITNILSAITLSVWIWLGFVVTVLLNGVLWEGRSVKLYLFNLAYYLGSFAILAVVIALLQ